MVRQVEDGLGDAVAVVGISCRFPGARDHHGFAANLRAGVSSIGEITPDRWDPAEFYSPDAAEPGRSVSKWCGMVDDAYGFDHAFFRVSPREARLTDPQQRLLLQESWNCVEDSGTALARIQRARTSVHVGVMGRDHLQLATGPGVPVESHSALGGYDCLLANRVSHVLGLRGASVSVDAACASSLVAVHLAARGLVDGEADFALAGGVSLNLHPWKYVSFSKARMLSPHGLCRTFDKDADGYVPGDGVAMLLLRRLQDAERDGDHVYGIVRGSAVNHGGRRLTVTAPTVDSQAEVVAAALDRAGVDPRTIGYVEAHGTGTSLGDPIEMEALRRVFAAASPDTGWCRVGSAKPNIGHLEAAAGAAGLIKVLMMMRDRIIPPSVHLDTPNPLIDFDGGPFRLARSREEWRSEDGGVPLRAGVSSFGMGGVNSHLVVEEYVPTRGRPARGGDGPTGHALHPFLLSAHSETSLSALLDRWRGTLTAAEALPGPLDDVCATLATGRAHSEYRVGGVVRDLDGLRNLVLDAAPPPTPVGADWWLCAGRLALPSAAVLEAFLCAPGPREVLDTLAAGADGLGDTVEGLRSGRRGPGEECLFGYLVLRLLLDHGLRPAAVCASGPGLWPALAAAESLEPADAVRLAMGEPDVEAELLPPALPFVDPATGSPVPAAGIDGRYLLSLVDPAETDADECHRVLAKAALLVGSQHTFRANLQEWNGSLRGAGAQEWAVPLDADALRDHGRERPDELLFAALAAHHALDRLNRKWELPRERLLTAQGTAEVLDLLLDGLLTAPDLVALLRGDAPGPVAARVVTRLREPGDRDPVSALGRFGGRGDMGPVRNWQDANSSGGPATPPGAAVVCVGDYTGPVREPSVRVAVDGDASLEAVLVRPLTELWLAGAPIDWELRYAAQQVRRLPLPTRVFDVHEHRLSGPARPASPGAGSAAAPPAPDAVSGADRPVAEAADRAVRVEAYWKPTGAEPARARNTGPVLVVASVLPGPAERERASRALAPRQVYWAHPGAAYAERGEGWTVDAEESGDWSRVLDSSRLRGCRDLLVIAPGPDGERGADSPGRVATTEALTLFALLRALAESRRTARVLHTDRPVGSEPSPLNSAVAALSRSLRRENTLLRLTSVAVDTPPKGQRFWALAADEAARDDGELVVRTGDSRLVRAHRVTPDTAGAASGAAPPGPGTYLVAGGGGGLGALVARRVLRDPGTRLVLLGRSPDPGAAVADLLAHRDRVRYLSADITDPDALSEAVARARALFGGITCVVNAAGVLRDSFLTAKSAREVREVLAPKLSGSVNLDLATRADPVENFVLFSSVVAVIGNPGQTDYGFANGFLEGFAARRRASAASPGRTVVIDWPLWEDGGMGVAEGAVSVFSASTGLTPMPTATGLALWDQALSANGAHRHILLHGDAEGAAALFSPDRSGEAADDGAAPSDGEPVLAASRAYCASVLCEQLAVPEEEIDHDAGLDQYGLDSIHITQFSARVEQDLGATAHTLLFESRTLGHAAVKLAALAPDALLAWARRHGSPPPPEESAQGQREGRTLRAAPSARPASRTKDGDGSGAVAVIGMAGRYPDADDIRAFWGNLLRGRDSVTEIPAERWDLRRHYAPAEADEGGMYCKWGAFLRGADRFDPLFFGISPREAELMDPQERLFLQTAWRTFEDAGYPPSRLGDPDEPGGRSVGVFVGLTTQSYLLWGPDHRRRGGTAVPNSTPWSVANRVSYWLDLHGPSMPVDTACASSLSAVHLACESLHRGECGMALVGGVNLYLHPSKYEWLCQMRMLSPTGRCHAFGSEADGFVPGEGVGALLLKPLRDAEADGDRVLGVIRGSAVNHGGRTSGFTVPNPRAQAALVEAALEDAGLVPEDIDYVEAHGTGTPLGDPVEIAGLSQVFGRSEGRPKVAIGSVKTNIGHLESAAGVAGLTKVLLQMRHGVLVPSLHAARENPRIGFGDTSLRLQREAAPWPERPDPGHPGSRAPRRAGVSSFGAGGANAHVVVEEYQDARPLRGPEGGDHLVVVSARDDERLRAQCAALADAIRSADEPARPSEVAYHLQVRREPFARRLALLVGGTDELVGMLEAEAEGHPAPVNRWATGDRTAAAGAEDVERAVSERDLPALAAHWVSGARVPWSALYPRPLPHVDLPGHPFAEEGYWIPDPPEGARGLSWTDGAPGEGERAHPFVDRVEEGGTSVRFTGSEFFLDDHRVDGVPIFPAVGYLEMAAAAVRARGGAVRAVRGNVWDAPVTVERPGRVHLALTERSDGFAYEVFSGTPDGDDHRLHGRGRVLTGPDGAGARAERVDLDAIRSRCPDRTDPENFYARVRERGLQLGPSYRGLTGLRFGRDEALTEIRLPAHLEEGAGEFLLHPAVLDSALQGSLGLLARRDPSAPLHLPFTIGSVEVLGPLPRHCFAHVVLRASSANGSKLDVRLMDPAGALLATVGDFWLRTWRAPGERGEGAGALGSFFEALWTADRVPGAPLPPGNATTLLLAPSLRAGRLLARTWRDDGTLREDPVVVVPGDGFRDLGRREFEVRPGEAADLSSLLAALPGDPHRRDAVVLWPRTFSSGGAAELDGQLADGAVPLLHLVRALLTAGDRAPARILCAFPGGPGSTRPGYEALGGLLRTARRESRRLSHRLVELPQPDLVALAGGDPAAVAERIGPELRASWEDDLQVRYREGERRTKVWRRCSAPSEGAPPLRREGVYVVSGGAGGLGALVARHLASTVSARLLLVGRSAGDERTEALVEQVRAEGGRARYVSADVSEAEGASRAVQAARDAYGTVHGVLHCAGVLRDGYLVHQDSRGLAEAAAPKARGALHLDAATRDDPLDLFVLFSSVASALGNPGQAGYSYANAFLDAFAERRQELRAQGTRSGTTLSLNWPLWAQGGMAVDEQVRAYLREQLGIRPLETDTGMRALEAALRRPSGQVLFVPGGGAEIAGQLGADGPRPHAPTGADPVAPTGSGPTPQAVTPSSGADRLGALGAAVAAEVADVAKLDASRVDRTANIGDYGFDSLSFSRLANQLNRRLGTDLTPAVFFEYTSVDDLSEHLAEEFPDEIAALLAQEGPEAEEHRTPAPVPASPAAEAPRSSPRPAAQVPAREREPIAIVGMHGVLPGSDDLEEYWENLDAGRDLVTEIPADRWDWREYLGDPLREPNTTNSKWGGFLREVDRFDARFFGISPREAELMDPQQRLFLQTSYKAVEEAGYRPSDLARGRTGLFVGVATHDYHELLREAGLPVEAYTTTGMFHAILANRVSYLLNLRGPSFPIDTACSSSLVAVRSAVESIWSGGCDAAIAGGVNLLLAPMIYISFARAGMLSPDGRCKAFDESANGYVRGEGAGALLLKPLSHAVRDGDHVHAVIRGSAVNHGGRVNTLTTPNPNAQSELIVQAFEEGGVDPATVGYMEVHGTGTALGDPIEVNGLKKAFRELRERAGLPPLTEPATLVGSVKSNIGHLEAAAGMAGIFKVILSMKHGRVPGNLHINRVNPHIKLEDSPLRLATSTSPWPRPLTDEGEELPRRAGVSSFGFGGVNGHVLLEEYQEAPPAPLPDSGAPRVFVLSARTPEQLAEYSRTLARAARAVPAHRGPRPGREEARSLVVSEIAGLLGVLPEDVHDDDELSELGLVADLLVKLRDRVREELDLPDALAHVAAGHTVADVVSDVGTASGDGAHGSDVWMRDAAHTLQVGREPMEHRLAVVARTPDELAGRLARFAETSRTAPGVHTGRAGTDSDRDPAAGSDPETLARHWAGGGRVDWAALHEGERPRRVSLPTYPFARTRHWIPAAATPAPAGRAAAATAPARGVGGEERRPGPVWVGADDRLVSHHRVRGERLLPGVAHLELVRAALTASESEPLELTRVVWSAPCAVSAPGRELSVVVTTDGPRTRFEVSGAQGGDSVVHASGTARVLGADHAVPRTLSVEEAYARCATRIDHDTVYRCFSRLGIDYGPYFRVLDEVRVGPGEAIARVRDTAGGERADAYTPHVPVMDAALQAVTAMRFEHDEEPKATPLPFCVESVRLLRPLRTAEYVHVSSRPDGGHDARVLDADGRECAVFTEVTVREARDPLTGLLFAPYWREQPLPEPAGAPVPGPGEHLVVRSADGACDLAEAIAHRCSDAGVRELRLGHRNARPDARSWEVDHRDPEGMAAALRQMPDVRHVWYLAGNGAAGASGDRFPEPRPERAAATLFRLVRALADADLVQRLRTLRVTVDGVQDVDGRRGGDHAGAGLLGFSKSLAKEYPHIDVVCADLDGVSGPRQAAELAEALLREPGQRGGEEVALAGERRYVRGLAPIELPPAAVPPFRTHGRYLVVGGAGGIGTVLARHLATGFAARIVLVGRRPADDGIRTLLGEIESLGGSASYLSADVSDSGRLRDVLSEARSLLGGIDGIVHAAMVLRDGIVERLDQAAFDAVMAPKAEGSMALARLVADEPLDFLLFMSSVQSFAGTAGQSNYAAASRAQDAAAQWLAARAAYPVRVVNWGFWGTVGHVASPEYRERLGARGYGSIAPEEGMAALERVIAGDERQVVVLRAEEHVLASVGAAPRGGSGARSARGGVPAPLDTDTNAEQGVLEGFVTRRALEALREAGLFRDPLRGHRRSALVRDSGALPKYGPLLDALADALTRHGLLVEEEGLLLAPRVAPTGPGADAEGLVREHPRLAARVGLAEACLTGLPRVLVGDLAATEVLFPAATTDLVSRIYRDEALVDHCNSVLADRVRAHAAHLLRGPHGGQRRVRILEIGAGTGATTRAVLAALDGLAGVSYDFTDVSESFLRRARREIDPRGTALGFGLLDVDRPLDLQGVDVGHYDVVIAANSLHASRDLGAALERTRSLLADGGQLVLTEVTRVLAFHTVTFGLLDGWWHHVDGDRRLPGSPLLDVEGWRRRLELAGFAGAVALGSAKVPGELSQRVIAADAAAHARPRETPTHREEQVASTAPRTPTAPRDTSSPDVSAHVAGVVRALVADCLGMPPDEVDDSTPLAAIGVDSIVGVELVNRVNQELGVSLKTIAVFDHPTVRELTAFLVHEHGTELSGSLLPPTPAATPTPAAAEEPRGTGPSVLSQGADGPVRAGEPVHTGRKRTGRGEREDRTGAAAAPPASGFRAVRFERPGNPRDLRVRSFAPVEPGPGEIEVQVKAFPVNFSDFLLAKGLYPLMPDFPFTPGVEVSGVVRRVGPHVRRLAVGDEVIALTRPEMGGQASVVVTDEDFAVHKPANVSHEQACGFPVAFLAMYLALEKAALREGENVLIEAAAGTNGLVAVQLAQLAGARVIATAGSPAKVDFLAAMGVADPIDHSRSDVAEEVLSRTGGRGVDVVVNTQADGALQRGLNLLAPEGRYVEIAVFGLQASGGVDLSHLVDNQSFHSFNTKKFFLRNPHERVRYLQIMADHLGSGRVRPNVAHVLPFERVVEAYALKEERATVGRVVVTVPDPAPETSVTAVTGSAGTPAPQPPGPPTDGDDIAVIGVSGRFPGAPDVEALWSNLEKGVSSVSGVPRERWDSDRYFDPDPSRRDTTYCDRGGFLEDVDLFDAPFFGISGKEAEQTDPQQRLFLQEAWRALEDAGYPSGALDGLPCGVFVGVGPSEYLTRMNKAGATKEAQAFWGNEASVLAARISYFLNLKGPSLAVNTACSSSLVALHLAVQSLRSGESSVAIAGGVFLTLAPDYFVVASNGNMLSPEGLCKTFDDSADGFGPGEGVGALVLKPLRRAIADGDHVHGVIKATAINQDGRTNGITAPSGPAQTQVELAAYRGAGIDPATIGYVEAHGTGTRLGDPIEVEALTRAFREYTDRTGFCAIGSVKTNIGHAAAAAGIAGVIKVLLSLRHRKIPASLNFERANRHIDFDNSPFYVNTRLREWATEGGLPRRAAVSGFGFSGTNAHVVLEEAPVVPRPTPDCGPVAVVPLSAHSVTALRARAADLLAWLDGAGSEAPLAGIAHTLQTGRDHFRERVALLAADRRELRARLREFLDTEAEEQGRAAPEEGARTGPAAAAAAAYREGEDVDWSALWSGPRATRLPLPTYPFDGHRYWYTEQDTVYARTADGTPDPFAPRVLAAPPGEHRLAVTLTGDEPFLRDHAVRGRRVLPGVLTLELVRRAAAAAGLRAHAVRDMSWSGAVLFDGGPVTLTVSLSTAENGARFEVGGVFGTHASGTLAAPDPGDPATEDLDALLSRCPTPVDPADHYRRLRGLGLVHGPSLLALTGLRVGGTEAVASLDVPRTGEETPPDLLLHPALLDGALQALAALGARAEDAPALPFSVREVAWNRPLPPRCRAHVRVRHAGPHLNRYDVRILDDRGAVLAALTDIATKRSETTSVPRTTEPDDALRELLSRLESGEIGEAQARAAMEALLAQ